MMIDLKSAVVGALVASAFFFSLSVNKAEEVPQDEDEVAIMNFYNPNMGRATLSTVFSSGDIFSEEIKSNDAWPAFLHSLEELKNEGWEVSQMTEVHLTGPRIKVLLER